MEQMQVYQLHSSIYNYTEMSQLSEEEGNSSLLFIAKHLFLGKHLVHTILEPQSWDIPV